MARVPRLYSRILMVLAALSGLGVLVVAAMLAIAAVDRRDAFTLPRAALKDAGFLARPLTSAHAFDDEALAVHAHRLAKGEGTVFGDRFYSNGSVFAIDDEVYEKLTVWIPHGPPDRAMSLELGQAGHAVAVYTQGGSAWPRHACAGIVHEGRLTIEPVRGFMGDTRWRVHLVGALRLREVVFEQTHCATRLERRFEGPALDFDELTPWLGAVGGRPLEETYR